MPHLQPNTYSLQSADGRTKVEYETATFTGQPTLNLSLGPGPIGPIRHFAGSQVRRSETEIGTLVSVTTQMSLDAGSISFSILIPAIGLSTILERQQFTTDAIITSHSGPDSVPPKGVHEHYQFVENRGEARGVLSAFDPLREAFSHSARA
jgi:hypothetical protein